MWREREGVNRKPVHNQHGLHADYANKNSKHLSVLLLVFTEAERLLLKEPQVF